MNRFIFQRKAASLIHSSFICCLIFVAADLHAQPTAQTVNEALLRSPQSRMRCSPVTPATKVPFIEITQLPDYSRDPLYFEGCSDLDTAWTSQSYPDIKYVPQRGTQHATRVNLLIQDLKEYVAAQSDDWVDYISNKFQATPAPSQTERSSFPNGDVFISNFSNSKDLVAKKFLLSSKDFGLFTTRVVTPTGMLISYKKRLNISGIDTSKLCITPVDLQKAFENQPGYLLRPMSARTDEPMPNAQALAKLGGQWFGYEVHVFVSPNTGQNSGLMLVGFSFKPCAARITIDLTKQITHGDKK